MSDTNQDKTARTPRLTIDQSATPANEPVDSKAEATELQDAAAVDFDEAMGLIKGTGAAIWSYAVRHPNTTLGAVAGFILAVLVLTLGLWDTLVIAFFVLIGAVIGQIRDGENGIVNFFGRLFNTKVDVADTELEADETVTAEAEDVTLEDEALVEAEPADDADEDDEEADESEDSLTYSNGVIEKIVAMATREVPHVLGMKGNLMHFVLEQLARITFQKGTGLF